VTRAGSALRTLYCFVDHRFASGLAGKKLDFVGLSFVK
jgi:hypothetical protein